MGPYSSDDDERGCDIMRTAHDQMIKQLCDSQFPTVDPALVQAIVCQESGGDSAAIRFEFHYYENAVVRKEAKQFSRDNKGIPTYETELVARSLSYGLMQIMGQVAREGGLKDRYLTVLIDPQTNLEVGIGLLARRLRYTKFDGDIPWVIKSWNAGMGCRKPSADDSYVTSVMKFMSETPY